MTQHQDEAEHTAAWYIVEEIHITIDQLRESWTWLCALVEPGRPQPTPATAMTDEHLERLEALGHSDRAYRDYNLRHRLSALPPSPAAARVGIIDAQVLVHDTVTTAARLLAATGGLAARRRAECMLDTVPAALDWLTGGPIAELGAGGRGGVWWRAGALDRLRDAQLAADVAKILRRADRVARAAAGAEEQPAAPVDERCPACGRRSLQEEYPSGRLVVRCVSVSCVCTGDGGPGVDPCGCGRRRKQAGRRHVWTGTELDELDAAVEKRRRPRPRLGRGAVGHGGWQSRDMAGQQ
jgi:hypothetical protein